MTVSLYNVVTVIAAIWFCCMSLSMFSEDIAMTIVLIITLLSGGVLMYRAGEFIVFLCT